MDPSDDEFPGFVLSRKTIEVKIDGINGTTRKIATWTAKNSPGKAAGPEFVWLGRRLSVFMGSEEFCKRFPPKNSSKLIEDLRNNASCKAWSANGSMIELSEFTNILPLMGDYKNGVESWRASKAPLNPEALTAYAIVWRRIGSEAFNFSTMYTARLPMGDYKFRFFCGPVNPKVTIYFSPLADWLTVDGVDVLPSLVKEMLESADKKPPKPPKPDWRLSFEIKTLSKFDADDQPYCTISINPFGYFRTLVLVDDLPRLVEALMGNREWPDPESLSDLNSEMLKRLNENLLPRKEVTITPMKFVTGDLGRAIKRAEAEDIMGGNANKWAKGKLGWKYGNCNFGPDNDKGVAEWLHRSASSFRNYGDNVPDPDIFENLMFGTQECNTNMLRAESAIHSFYHHARAINNLDLEKSGATLTTTVAGKDGEVEILLANGRSKKEINKNLMWATEDKVEYPWIVPQLEYEVEFKLVFSDRTNQLPPFKYSMSFLPFYRYCPFRPEISLDARVMNYYFDKVLFPPPPVDPPTKESV